jgi:hypothetical protein
MIGETYVSHFAFMEHKRKADRSRMSLTWNENDVKDVTAIMLQLWGPRAANIALTYAKRYTEIGNSIEATRWHNVHQMIARPDQSVTQSDNHLDKQSPALALDFPYPRAT